MLEDILNIINRDGYISRPRMARELNVDESVVDDGMGQLIRMGYLAEEETGENCSSSCANCPFAKTCNKEIIKTFKLTDKGSGFVKKAGSDSPLA